MSNAPFIGREHELNLLDDLLQKKTASLVVINGRRRIGKSRLVEEFAKNHTFYEFSGLAPVKGIKAQDQRNEFAIQLSQQTNLPEVKLDDWSKLFLLLAEKVKKDRVIILLDEITWMAQDDKTFLSKLKNAWDIYFKKNAKLILILCGSISSWIEKNIISSTGYFGRVSLHLTLSELSISCCNQLLNKCGFRRSTMEKLMFLSLTGGIPWYIEQINPQYSAIENIKKLCFQKTSILVKEFHHIFHDLFGRRSELYQKIVRLLAKGNFDYDSISKKLGYAKGSALSDYLSELILSGYIRQYHNWYLKTGLASTLSLYRLSDNYLRFYFKYMSNKINRIREGKYTNVSLESLPGWHGMLGLQFENLVLNNRHLVLKTLSIKPEDVISDGPYFQRKSKRQKGCQIDYLIQTKYNNLFVCEIKFSKNSIGVEIIEKMKEKIDRLSIPRGFSVLPVLIHVSDVSDEVYDIDYFIKIIDFRNYLE